MDKKKVFISFDFDKDSFLRDSFVGQCRNNNTPFDIEDWSVKEPWEQSEWKERCLTKIRRCDLVIVLVGEETYHCNGVLAEIKMAKESFVPVVAIKGYANRNCPLPDGLTSMYNWTWSNIAALVRGER